VLRSPPLPRESRPRLPGQHVLDRQTVHTYIRIPASNREREKERWRERDTDRERERERERGGGGGRQVHAATKQPQHGGGQPASGKMMREARPTTDTCRRLQEDVGSSCLLHRHLTCGCRHVMRCSPRVPHAKHTRHTTAGSATASFEGISFFLGSCSSDRDTSCIGTALYSALLHPQRHAAARQLASSVRFGLKSFHLLPTLIIRTGALQRHDTRGLRHCSRRRTLLHSTHLAMSQTGPRS
jgi:hypothetical protein